MFESAKWLELESVDSTQNEAARRLQGEGFEMAPDVILALEQTAGRGRFGRTWHSQKGECLAMSLLLKESVGHPRPWLLGMAAACACAKAFGCRLRWPNDLMLGGKKMGGILSEVVQGVPVVGIGVNLTQRSFPADIASTATSMHVQLGSAPSPREASMSILAEFAGIGIALDWRDLELIWGPFDDTPGKLFRLPSGEEAIARGIGPNGELLCAVNGKLQTVFAADALAS